MSTDVSGVFLPPMEAPAPPPSGTTTRRIIETAAAAPDPARGQLLDIKA